MLPCSEFGPQKGQKTDETMDFVVGEHFSSEATNEWRWNEEWEETNDFPKEFWIAKKGSATTHNRIGTHSSVSGVQNPSS